MICRSIRFTDFRNIESAFAEFTDAVNVLWGNNAQGKSNILEGIYYFARGRSFRGAKDRELIRFGEEALRSELCFSRDDRQHRIGLSLAIARDGKKRIERNGAQISMREMIGDFKAVLFCPAHLSLASGGPSGRRSFLDIAISQLNPSYLSALYRYNKALRERNALCKLKAPKDSLLWDTYSRQLATYGSLISSYRLGYVSLLEDLLIGYFTSMTNGSELPQLTYVSGSSLSDELAAASPISPPTVNKEWESRLYSLLMDSYEKDINIGATTYGPHRDDIRIRLCGKDAARFASQGQQRSLALSMKLAEGDIAAELIGEYPVFLLDDVLSELDLTRRRFVLNTLSDRQIIVTSCEPDYFNNLDFNINLLHVEAGKLI